MVAVFHHGRVMVCDDLRAGADSRAVTDSRLHAVKTRDCRFQDFVRRPARRGRRPGSEVKQATVAVASTHTHTHTHTHTPQ